MLSHGEAALCAGAGPAQSRVGGWTTTTAWRAPPAAAPLPRANRRLSEHAQSGARSPPPRLHRPDFPGGPGGGAFGLPGYPERRMRCSYCRWVPAQCVLLFSAELSRNPPLVKADSARYARLLFALAIIKALNVLCEAVCRKPSPTSRNPALGAIYRMKSRSKPKKMQNTVKERG